MSIRYFEASTPASAWEWARKIIKTNGKKVVTEDGQVTREIDGMTLRILYPDVGWPISGSGWKIPALEEYYQNEIISPDNPTGFEYTYGERLRAWESHEIPDSYNVKTDQVEYIIRKLKANRTTRRAVGCTWNPLTDEKPGFHPPCLMVADFKIRGEALNLIAYFRSHDIEQAWPQNVYGLYKLQEYIAGEVYAELGTLTTISASAHIYINPGEEA